MVHTCHVDAWVKSDTWRPVRIILIAKKLHRIYSAFVYWLPKKTFVATPSPKTWKKNWPASQTDRNKICTNPKIIVHKYTSSLNYCIGISSPRYRESWDSAYMIRADDGASPRTHKQVIAIIHSIAHSAISNPFLSPLKLFQQSEVSWNCGGISSQTKKNELQQAERRQTLPRYQRPSQALPPSSPINKP